MPLTPWPESHRARLVEPNMGSSDNGLSRIFKLGIDVPHPSWPM
jgi:hypothetical protein